MVKLDMTNVILKPSNRKQLMGWLRRSLKFGQRLGDFVLTITVRRIGHLYEVRAAVHDRVGDFLCRVRRNNWREAFRILVWNLAGRLHDQHLRRHMP